LFIILNFLLTQFSSIPLFQYPKALDYGKTVDLSPSHDNQVFNVAIKLYIVIQQFIEDKKN